MMESCSPSPNARRPFLGRVGAAFVILFLGGCLSDRSAPQGPPTNGQAPATQASAPNGNWLSGDADERRDQLEHHLRGLDIAMVEIGYRFNELYFAGEDRNWPYAQYQAEKIELAMRLALERRPKRSASARPFLDETIPFVKQAIHTAASDPQKLDFVAAMERLRTDCMKCHVAENVPHFTVYFPKTRGSPIHPEVAP